MNTPPTKPAIGVIAASGATYPIIRSRVDVVSASMTGHSAFGFKQIALMRSIIGMTASLVGKRQCNPLSGATRAATERARPYKVPSAAKGNDIIGPTVSKLCVGHAHEACLSVVSALTLALMCGVSPASAAAPAPAGSDNGDLPGDLLQLAPPRTATPHPRAARRHPRAAWGRLGPRRPRLPPSMPRLRGGRAGWCHAFISRHRGKTRHRFGCAIRAGPTFDFGAFDGGTDLATAQYTDGSSSTLSGGTGVFASVGAIWTPIWVGDALGLGVGLPGREILFRR